MPTLRGDRWEGIRNPEWSILNATEEDLLTALSRLDGKAFTMVVIAHEGATHLAIGGGDAFQYVVYATFDNVRFPNLLTDKVQTGTVQLTVGGQPGDYPADQIVGQRLAFAVAMAFFADGTRLALGRWRHQ
jgi:hypothetical protein